MKNNDERKAFVKDDANWEPHAVTDFTTTEKLTYKGETWYRVMIIEYDQRFDYNKHRFVRCVNKVQAPFNTYYKVNEEHNALDRRSYTDVVKEIQNLDKQYPDRASAPAIPSTIDIERGHHE